MLVSPESDPALVCSVETKATSPVNFFSSNNYIVSLLMPALAMFIFSHMVQLRCGCDKWKINERVNNKLYFSAVSQKDRKRSNSRT